jgi:predicted Fe-Mo cluster-binding NifX family protein
MDTKKNTYKIAVPSMGAAEYSLVSNSFGRCPFIIIYDKDDKKYRAFENPGAKVQDGSGLKAAQILIRNKADLLLTLEIGKKAYSVLSKEYIDIRLLESASSVKDEIQRILKNG